ncbi:MAG: hypothetical protein KDA78_12720 [Planctomycetaceae bacterium]|nr:hypothetical protein [Planctomycetaceae bacterium]
MQTRFYKLQLCFAWIILLMMSGGSLKADEPQTFNEQTPANRVFVKIILPLEPAGSSGIPVEDWIQRSLHKRGNQDLQAVTGWVPLKSMDEETVPVWNGVVNGSHWGCPVSGHPVVRLNNGFLKVDLTGWAPAALDQTGMTVPDEPGSRTLGIVDNGLAFVAILVVPEE